MSKTGLWYGWAGRILDIDLSRMSISKQPLSLDFATKYIGGSGFGIRRLYDEVEPEVVPLAPENVVYITQGPLGGTLSPSSGRYDLITKSPLTGIFLRTNGGGFFGPELKWAGYDLIIIRGKSERPVYLWINNDDVQLRDASHIWGRDTWTTERMIRDELGDPEIKTLKIGPAGENLSLSACVIGDLSRAAGKGAIGAVFGSKKLKAIAVRGTKGVNIAHPDQLEKICDELSKRIKGDPLYDAMRRDGTVYTVWEVSRPWEKMPLLSRLTAADFREKYFDENLACFNCQLHCSHYYTVKEGKYKGTKGEGMEANALFYGNQVTQIGNPAFTCKYNNLCNQLGLHVDHPGTAIGWAMNLFKDGIITKEDTDGIELTHGNEEAVLELMHKMAYNEGFGAVLNGYPLRAAKQIGRGSELYISHTKGMPRSVLTINLIWMLGLSVATRGADHLIGARTLFTPNRAKEITNEILKRLGEERYGDPNMFIEPWSISNKGQFLFDCENEYALCDSTGTCKFMLSILIRDGLRNEDFAKLLEATTGVNYTLQSVVQAGEREMCLERAFNARQGIRRIDDYPPPFYWELKYGQRHPRIDYKAIPIDVKTYDKLLDEYYEWRGCDLETGIPTRQKLEQLGLRDVADDLAKRGILLGKGE